MILSNGFFKPWGRALLAAALLLVFTGCGDSDEDTPSFSAAFENTGTTSLTAKGYANNPHVVLTGKTGAAYTVTVTEGGAWCWTSRVSQSTTRSATLIAHTDVLYLYLADNGTGAERTASVVVAFDGGAEIPLTIRQESYSVPASYDRAWPELPAYVANSDYTYVTHHAPLSASKTARNFTICYEKSARIARWVAYPIHACYTSGSYKRPDDKVAWRYDPDFSKQDQANLIGRSYRSGGIRGHQCMSNHRYVSYKSDPKLPSSDLNLQTFYSTNIMPQNSVFNGGSWLRMENVASENKCADTLYIVTGNYGVRGAGSDQDGKSVTVPEYCWKVLLRTKSGKTGKRISEITDASQLMTVGFWAENASSSETGLKEYITSVADIESKTGYKFFPMIQDAIADDVKAQNNPSQWGIN